MGKIEDITVGLPVELVEEIRRAVQSGQFSSEADVVLEAVRSWREARDLIAAHGDELGKLWDDGIASGAGKFASIGNLVAEAERRSGSTLS